MKNSAFAMVSILVLAALLVSPPARAEAPSAIAFAVEFDDGTRLVGTPDLKAITVESILGTGGAPLSAIASVDFTQDKNEAVLRFMNGDRLTVRLKTDSFRMRTLIGEVTVPLARVTRISAANSSLGPQLRKDLVLYYSFDGKSGMARDLSGKGNHGKIHNAKWTRDGKVGGAYEFDGKTAYVETPHSESLGFEPNEFTLAVWVRPSAWTGRTGMNALVTKGQEGDQGCWLLRVAKRHETGNVAKLNTETAVGRRFANREVTLNQWHHVVMRKARSRLTIYLDGKEDGAFDHSPALDTTGPLRICGQWPDPHDWGIRERFNGLIDEFMVFSRALSAEEIQHLWEAP